MDRSERSRIKMTAGGSDANADRVAKTGRRAKGKRRGKTNVPHWKVLYGSTKSYTRGNVDSKSLSSLGSNDKVSAGFILGGGSFYKQDAMRSEY